MNILILYATREGQTAKIAEYVAQRLQGMQHQVNTQSVSTLPRGFKLEPFDAAILGGPIHIGHYPRHLTTFAKQHHTWLNSHPSALFTVCMAIRSKVSASRTQAETFGEQFGKATLWQPRLKATFAGAVKYTQYGFITRYIMKSIAGREGGSTDTSRDHEYTDWDAVAAFSEQFARSLSG